MCIGKGGLGDEMQHTILVGQLVGGVVFEGQLPANLAMYHWLRPLRIGVVVVGGLRPVGG